MEREFDFKEIKEIMGKNFIGVNEIERILPDMKLKDPQAFTFLPKIPFCIEKLKKVSNSHILFLGIPILNDDKPVTINNLRSIFGVDPGFSEPCFYNQDWYLNEKFAAKTFKYGWYLISKNIDNSSRGKTYNEDSFMSDSCQFPSAVLTSYLFFLNYFHSNKQILLEYDYAWNSDLDSNNDRIYVGSYRDRLGINKNGFEIHRHLSIKMNYGRFNYEEK